MNLLLLDPAQRNGVPELYENLGLASLASCTRKAGYDTEVLLTHVEGWSYRRLGREIMKRQADVLGISLLSFDARKTLNLIRQLRKEGLKSKVVVGGHFPTFNDEILLKDWPELDAVVRGEGELTLLGLLRAWQSDVALYEVQGITFRKDGVIFRNDERPLVRDLDVLPWPVRDYTERIIEAGGTLNMSRARGCYANCAFCSIASFYRSQGGPGWRQRSIGNVLSEMEYLSNAFPGVEIKFHDDQFIGPGKNGWEDAMELANEIVGHRLDVSFSIFARPDTVEPELFGALKAAGLSSVFVGVESGSQRQLDTCSKRTTVEDNLRALQVLDDLGIRFIMGLIFFDPYTEMTDIRSNMEFLQETQPYWGARGNILSIENKVIVYKGTPYFDRLTAEDRMGGDYIDCTYEIRDWRVRHLCRISHLLLRYILPAISYVKLLPAHLRLLRIGLKHRLKGLLPSRRHVAESAR